MTQTIQDAIDAYERELSQCSNNDERGRYAIPKANALVAILRAGDQPATAKAVKVGRMIQIADLISELTGIQDRWGNTCVYIRDMSWGAVALNRRADDEQALAASEANHE